MDARQKEILNFLSTQFLFQGLNEEQLGHFVNRFRLVEYPRDTLIFSQGEKAEHFYILLKGRVRVIHQRDGRERLLNILKTGDYFGEEALLLNQPRSASVRTIGHVTLLALERQHFVELMEEFPEIKRNLRATAESRTLARRLKFDWLAKDEVIHFISRKHEFFLLTSLLAPILVGIGAIPLLAYGMAISPSLWRVNLLEVGALLMMMFAVGWGLWNWMDWCNDYYIVTNQRVIWLEKVIGLYESRQEAPMDTILAVDVVSSQLGRILKYGDVTVRTYTGNILMRRASQPFLLASFVDGFKRIASQRWQQADQRTMDLALERSLRRTLNLPEPKPTLTTTTAPIPLTRPSPPPRTLKEKLKRLLKVRYEENGIITYRKHWFILFLKSWKPLVAGVILAIVFAFLWNSLISILGFTLVLLAGFLYLGIFGWLVYDYLDWSNDIYRLTPDQIFDIERKPLGREVKKSAPLESILSIEHERNNIIGILLNFGDVIVNIGQTQFIFHGVYNPDQVHQDIAVYREALKRRKQEAEKARERERMVSWLTTFYRQAEKIEQERNQQVNGSNLE